MADYFRYILSLNSDFVLLKEELQCIEQYAKVQKIRYQDNFELVVRCQTDPEKEQIPPFLIQTFIENSIKHNIMIVEDLLIQLQIEEAGDQLVITISDNGVGMSDEVISRLENGENIEENGQHIGIFNIINRVSVLYGGKADIRMCRQNAGTKTVIRVPRIREEKKNADIDRR